MPSTLRQKRPLRLLTIGNGGLQAISTLTILKRVCEAVSDSGDCERPCELFDIIAGVGTGGWLALLLGRYKLTLQQSVSIYIEIATAITPNFRPSLGAKQSRNPAAISQEELIDKIAEIIEKRQLCEYLLDEDDKSPSADVNKRSCHAFAVGVTNSSKYRLFRTYSAPRGASYKGPDPRACRVVSACAATAAAKDFMQEYKLGDDTFWDADFPRTHNVTQIALNEAYAIFGESEPLSVVLNISPGVPNQAQIRDLRKAVRINGTKGYRIRDGFHRLWTTVSEGKLIRRTSDDFPIGPPTATDTEATVVRRNSYPQEPKPLKERSNTGNSASSVSSQVIKQEYRHEEAVKQMLDREYGDHSVYYRLAVTPKHENFEDFRPYLNDILHPAHVERLAAEFLEQSDTQSRIKSLQNSWSKCRYRTAMEVHAETENDQALQHIDPLPTTTSIGSSSTSSRPHPKSVIECA